MKTYYEWQWTVETEAERLFKLDHPNGTFARRLPQFRSSYPNPVGDYYRRQAELLLQQTAEGMGGS